MHGPDLPPAALARSGLSERPAKNQPFQKRLRFAASGIRTVAGRECSFRAQAFLAAAALAAAGLVRAAPVWWALLALTIGLVLALECMNGALEYALDRLHPDQHPEIGRAKDAAAGAVLVASLAASCIGVLMVLAAR